MHTLHAADILVIAFYLVAIAVIGVWSSGRIRLSADFFMPRRFGKLMMVMFSFGTGTHKDQAVGVAAKSTTSGLSGIWYPWLWLPVTAFYWLIAPMMRRFRAITTANVFEARYNLSVAMLYAVVGMLGVFSAALLAAVMSSCDAFMIASSALFTENLYRPLVPGRPERHYLTVGRIAAVAIVSAGVAFACWLPGVVAGLEIFWKILAMMGLAFWLGLFWRRATAAGAWAATLISFAAWFSTSRIAFGEFVLWDFNARVAPYLPKFMVWQGQLYLPWQMVLYLLAGFIGGVVVSLLTRPAPGEKLENFYALPRTPVKPGEQACVSCTLPTDTVAPRRRNLFTGLALEIQRPSATGVLGFLAGWVCVGVLVAVVYAITRA